jgi:uncharacterized repeat protein (TIGR03803 family)
VNFSLSKTGLPDKLESIKTCVKNLFLTALTACISLIPNNYVLAQTSTNLHNFTQSPDGANPQAGLILSDNILYGTARSGGSSSNGTIFAVNTDNESFTNIYNFTAVSSGSSQTNSDGANPVASLILSGNTLYGTTILGGSSGSGTVFRFSIDGSDFTNLHSFTAIVGNRFSSTNSDGANPYAGLILSGNTLYGAARNGGSSGAGTIYAVNTDASGFTNLHNFSGSDGAFPYASLILSGGTLYGTTERSGSSGYGTVFAINTDSTGFTNLYNFTAISSGPSQTNSDGATPVGLVLFGNTLYGTAQQGGNSGNGTLFAMNTNGTSFTNLYNFTAIAGFYHTNSDGASPNAGLILSGCILYGTATEGGKYGNGTVFSVNTNGTDFTNLYSFTAGTGSFPNITNSDGVNPSASLILSGNTLYGTASFGGSSAFGTVFSLSYPSPELTISRAGAIVDVMWPTGVAGFSYNTYTLHSTTNLVLPTVWSAVSNTPSVINSNYVVTNAISGAQTFYRLSQ